MTGTSTGTSTRDAAVGRPVGTSDTDLRREIELHLETLRDLGPEYTEPVARALVSHFDSLIEERVQLALRESGAHRSSSLREKQRFVLLILGFGIPLLAIAGGTGGAFGVLLVAAALFVMSIVAMTHNF